MKVFTFTEWLKSKQWDRFSYLNATENTQKALVNQYQEYLSRNKNETI